MFDEADGMESSANVKDGKDGEALGRHASMAATAFEIPQRDTDKVEEPVDPIDLLALIPETFQEIPYETSINKKRRSMESFNNELAKLVQEFGKKQIPVKSKDYMLVINTVVHMLEDKNMLVFVEAIKTVELLSKILGPHGIMKPSKIKMFINLLAGKYGETKTAVIAAVDKGMEAIVTHAYS